MMSQDTWSIPPKLSSVADLCTAVFQKVLNRYKTKRYAHEVELALDEAVTNIIKHGKLNNINALIHVSLSINSSGITLSIRDFSPPFNPAHKLHNQPDQYSEKDDELSLGMGLMIIHKTMDSLEYERFEDGNFLIIKKDAPAPCKNSEVKI